MKRLTILGLSGLFLLVCISCTETKKSTDNKNPDAGVNNEKDDSDIPVGKDDNDTSTITENQPDDSDIKIDDSEIPLVKEYHPNCIKLFKAACEKQVSCDFPATGTVTIDAQFIDCDGWAKTFCDLPGANSGFADAETSLFDSCLNEINVSTCQQFNDEDSSTTPSCDALFIGKIENGSPCFEGSFMDKPCKDGYCKVGEGDSCGICTPYQQIGDNCDSAEDTFCFNKDDDASLLCSQNKCTALPLENQPCLDDQCADELYCDRDTDPQNPKCKKPIIAKLGETCDFDKIVCDENLECDWNTEKCIVEPDFFDGDRLPGETCDQENACAGFLLAYCKASTANAKQGICTIGEYPKSGEPCEISLFPACGFIYLCDENTGLCKGRLADGETCNPEEEGWDCQSNFCDSETSKCSAPMCI